MCQNEIRHGRLIASKAIRRHLSRDPLKVLRDGYNRLRYSPDPPLSDELIWIDPLSVTHWYKPDPDNGAPACLAAESGLELFLFPVDPEAAGLIIVAKAVAVTLSSKESWNSGRVKASYHGSTRSSSTV